MNACIPNMLTLVGSEGRLQWIDGWDMLQGKVGDRDDAPSKSLIGSPFCVSGPAYLTSQWVQSITNIELHVCALIMPQIVLYTTQAATTRLPSKFPAGLGHNCNSSLLPPSP